MRQAKGEFIVILNPDTIVDSDWLSYLIEAYNKFGRGLYQPKLVSNSSRNKFNSAGNMIQIFGFGYSRGKGDIDQGQFDKEETVGYASGACLFSSHQVLSELGFFDSFLFAYHDDLDLGWRGAMQGIKSYYIPRSIVYHEESFSFKWSSFKFFLLERNRHYCLLTHYSHNTFFKLLPSIVIVEIITFIFYLSRGMLKAKIKAYGDIIKNRSKIQSKYSELQKNRNTSDKEIIKNFQDEIFVPKEVSNNFSNKLFNKLIRFLSLLSRRII